MKKNKKKNQKKNNNPRFQQRQTFEAQLAEDLRQSRKAMEGVDPTLFRLVDQHLASAYPEEPAFTRCIHRAYMCAEAIRRLTGRIDISVLGGRMFARTGLEDFIIGWDPYVGPVQEMHAWVMLGDVILDPSVRHLPEYAANLGTTWCRPRLPYVCAPRRLLASAGFAYEHHAGATEYAVQQYPLLQREVNEVAAACVALLAHPGAGIFSR